MLKSLFFLCAVFLISGCKASEPGKMESLVMTTMKHKVTIGGKDTKNPVAYNPATLKDGQAHFGHHCQVCHGLDGQNTGVPFATRMSPPVPDLKTADVQGYADGQLKWIIEHGIEPSGMPGWKAILQDDEMWKIVHYIRHLPPKGSLGAPNVYKEAAAKHEDTKGAKPHQH